uniref:Uncharacterized protein n=1 Tax=Varanus komodoensis TaxID=61221 RepID=A0A8D2LX60_VARKO
MARILTTCKMVKTLRGGFRVFHRAVQHNQYFSTIGIRSLSMKVITIFINCLARTPLP